jgi:hypothetical protein
MSHQVQLSPAASHRPTAALDPAGHAAEPSACPADVRTPPAGQDMCRIPPALADPICTGIFHTSAKDSRASPEDRQAGAFPRPARRSRQS